MVMEERAPPLVAAEFRGRAAVARRGEALLDGAQSHPRDRWAVNVDHLRHARRTAMMMPPTRAKRNDGSSARDSELIAKRWAQSLVQMVCSLSRDGTAHRARSLSSAPSRYFH